jgi:hypothetical protein
MLRVLDTIISGLLLIVAALMLVLWFRSHTTGDRYRWEEMHWSDSGGLVVRSGAVWSGEGGVAFSTELRATDDPRSAERLLARLRRFRWAPVGYSAMDEPRYPMQGGSGNSPLSPIGVHFMNQHQQFGRIDYHAFAFTVPIWLVTALLAIYPLGRYFAGVLHREREERRMLGLCPRCGVDVRSNPERCPGCGKRTPLIPARGMPAVAIATPITGRTA